MFRKVHYRLTLLCAGITIFILITMSFIYLYVSESGLKKNQFLSFQRDMATILANLEQQTVITHEWLSKIENNQSYLIAVFDNEVSFLFNNRDGNEKKGQAVKEAMDIYSSRYPKETSGSDFSAAHTEYEFTSSAGVGYYACFALLPYRSGEVKVLILSSQEKLYAQIKEQRTGFFLVDAAAVFFLLLFSYFFTKKLLLPIEKSRMEQIQFVASASHELKTPLAVILSCANACKKASPEEAEGFLSTIQSEGKRMTRLIEEMLLLSKADTHSFQMRYSMVELDTLLLSSYEAFEPMAVEKKLRFRILLPDGTLPPCYSDEEKLRQVLSILIHNAVSYTPEHGKITLSLSYIKQEGRRPGSFSITVSDNGPGISDEEKEKIFNRFYRADPSRSSDSHFGLGLSIASEVMDSLNGSVRVTDTNGGGSTFTVTIPELHPISS